MKLTKNSKGQFILTDNGQFINSITLDKSDHLIDIYGNANNVNRLEAHLEAEGLVTFYGKGLDVVGSDYEPNFI